MRLIAFDHSIRHPKIHQSHIRTVVSKLFDRFLSVGGLCYQLIVWLSIDQGHDPLQQEGMIINGERSN